MHIILHQNLPSNEAILITSLYTFTTYLRPYGTTRIPSLNSRTIWRHLAAAKRWLVAASEIYNGFSAIANISPLLLDMTLMHLLALVHFLIIRIFLIYVGTISTDSVISVNVT